MNETTVHADGRKQYEAPQLFEAGSFQEDTGFIGFHNIESDFHFLPRNF